MANIRQKVLALAETHSCYNGPSEKTSLEQTLEDQLQMGVSIARALSYRLSVKLPNCDPDEMFSIGLTAVWEAVRSYDDSKGPLGKRITYLIRRRIQDHKRAMDPLSRGVRRERTRREAAFRDSLCYDQGTRGVKYRASFEFSLDSTASNEAWNSFDLLGVVNPVEAIGYRYALAHDLLDKLWEMNPRWACAISLYYYHGMTMLEIGRAMGVNESRISQMVRSGTEKMGELAKCKSPSL